jgi:hypothetical protein
MIPLRRSARLNKTEGVFDKTSTKEHSAKEPNAKEQQEQYAKEQDKKAKQRKLRCQVLADAIIKMPKGLNGTYTNLSKADALEQAVIRYESGMSDSAENKLAAYYYRSFKPNPNIVTATHVENIQSLSEVNNEVKSDSKAKSKRENKAKIESESDTEVANILLEIKELKNIHRVVLPNGTIYEGEMKNGLFHGYGTFTYPMSEMEEVRPPTYQGYFSNNLEHGHGRYDWGLAYDCYYEGEFVNGYYHGQGIRVGRDNDGNQIYENGTFRCGKFVK